MNPNPVSNCPFFISGKIIDRQFLIGRDRQINAIISHIQSDQPQSTNFDTHRLEEFAEAEAQALVGKPDALHNPAIGEERQALALNWGGRHPRRLQIAALCLWEARRDDRKDSWAQQQFEERSKGVPRKLQPMKQLVWGVMRLGRWAQSIGNTADDLGNFFKGAFILLLLLLAVTGVAKLSQIQDWFQGEGKEIKGNFK